MTLQNELRCHTPTLSAMFSRVIQAGHIQQAHAEPWVSLVWPRIFQIIVMTLQNELRCDTLTLSVIEHDVQQVDQGRVYLKCTCQALGVTGMA
jgi:hypothetical protein